ncbi:MAG: GAF domain-containing protein [Spirochaetes bacterium]|nr:GAF domain-containing protein [Spirochaetota bacterium]
MEEKQYETILGQLEAVIGNETNFIANMANISAVLYQQLKKVNWAGFYLLDDQELVLGPFQGNPACIRIPIGKGVCGTAARELKTVIVKDVHQFPGHIACDAASLSEIVVPIVKEQQLIGVLDIDSNQLNTFNQLDQKYLEKVVALLINISKIG